MTTDTKDIRIDVPLYVDSQLKVVQQLQGLCDQLDHMIHQVLHQGYYLHACEEERTQLKAVRESLAQQAQDIVMGLERLTREQTEWYHKEAAR